MATDCISQLTLKFQQKMKPGVARFDTEHASTDGGAILLKALAGCGKTLAFSCPLG
jgi:hypothetical protein